MKMDLDALLLQESRRTLDLSGCKSAEELLKSILNKTDENAAEFETDVWELSEEELEQVNAAEGTISISSQNQSTLTPGDQLYF